MVNKTLLSMAEAAEMVGLTRPTFYRKAEELELTTTDKNGKKHVDVSELIRVFGNDVKIHKDQKDEPSKVSKKVSTDNEPKEDDTDRVELAVLREKVKHLEELYEKSEEDKDRLHDNLKEAQKSVQSITMLLEDKREKGTNDWERSIKALEKRIANQERAVKEKEEREQKILRQNRSLKKALTEEKNKSIWQKLFG